VKHVTRRAFSAGCPWFGPPDSTLEGAAKDSALRQLFEGGFSDRIRSRLDGRLPQLCSEFTACLGGIPNNPRG